MKNFEIIENKGNKKPHTPPLKSIYTFQSEDSAKSDAYGLIS